MKTEKIIHQCCYCGSIQDDDGKYDGVKREIIRKGNVSHGICPLCFDVEINKLEMNDVKICPIFKNKYSGSGSVCPACANDPKN